MAYGYTYVLVDILYPCLIILCVCVSCHPVSIFWHFVCVFDGTHGLYIFLGPGVGRQAQTQGQAQPGAATATEQSQLAPQPPKQRVQG